LAPDALIAKRWGWNVQQGRHNKATEFRQRADHVRAIAEQMSLKSARDQLLETAKQLMRLAEEERRVSAAVQKPSPSR